MRLRMNSSYRITSLIGVLLVLLGLGLSSAQAQESSTTWDKPQQVQRKTKPKRVSKPHPKVQLKPLLTVQYRVLIKRPDGTEGEASVASVFHPGDQLRLGVTANQSGYLYVIHQKENEDGVIMFPDSRVNNGENDVNRNQEFILPPKTCPAPDPSECWYKVTDEPTKDFFIIVFSRDQIIDLPNKAGANDAVKEALASGVLKKEVIDSYVRSARMQDYKIYSRPAKANSPASRYAIWVTNTNRADNEEVIVRVPLNKGT
jgi:Domain of unknown function (DUF4384)